MRFLLAGIDQPDRYTSQTGCKNSPKMRQIRRLLKDQWMRPRDIIQATGIKKTTVEAYLAIEVLRGHVWRRREMPKGRKDFRGVPTYYRLKPDLPPWVKV